VVARLVAAVVVAALMMHRWGPADLLAMPERPFAYGAAAVRVEGAAYPRFATGADNVRLGLDRPPHRLVSQDPHADEFLYDVVPAERVVGVSSAAYDRRISNVFELVERHQPAVSADLERVLRLAPDLVLTPASARAETPSLLRHAGIPVYRFYTMYETLAAIDQHLRLVGYLTGEDGRAAEAIRRFDATIARAAARRPVSAASARVLGLGGSYSYGSRTLFTDILRVLGAENVAAQHGLVGYDRISDEQIVRWDPQWIVAGAEAGAVAATRTRLLAMPAIAATRAGRDGHVVVLDNRVFLPLSPFTAQLVTALADAFYGGAA
jgi:iron complex transport system substrate-binding protein